MHRQLVAPWAFQAPRRSASRWFTGAGLLDIEHRNLTSTLWAPRALAVGTNRDYLLAPIALGKIALRLWTSHAAALEQAFRYIATQTLRKKDGAHPNLDAPCR